MDRSKRGEGRTEDGWTQEGRMLSRKMGLKEARKDEWWAAVDRVRKKG